MSSRESSPSAKEPGKDWLQAGVFDGDDVDRHAVRAAVAKRIQEKNPIFPNRRLGLEYAVFSGDTPRGLPCPEVTVANLRAGDKFPLNGQTYEVVKIAATITFKVTDHEGVQKEVRLNPSAASWRGFLRDIEGLLMGYSHGVEAGDLPAAWNRDPVAKESPVSAPRTVFRKVGPFVSIQHTTVEDPEEEIRP